MLSFRPAIYETFDREMKKTTRTKIVRAVLIQKCQWSVETHPAVLFIFSFLGRFGWCVVSRFFISRFFCFFAFCRGGVWIF